MPYLTPTDGMQITSSARLRPGVYHLPRGITIAAPGVRLNGAGVLLVGAGRRGQGVTVAEGCDGVSINSLRVQEYYHGIVARRVRNLTIEDCQVAATAEEPPNTLFLNIWLPAAQAYGGGILLHEVKDSRITGNDLQHQMNGLLCYGCSNLTVRKNLASYCSGFGIHLFETCDSLYEANYADFCCRYYGGGHMGADAAGFLIAHSSCRNIFRGNIARMSGDGFFLAGLTPQWQHTGCDDNLFEENDGSYSPNIAFEATFSRGNLYRNNRADGCNYGFWLGFSAENRIEGNQMRNNRQAGIAVENGYGFVVRENRFEANTHGILLWSRYVAEFAGAVPQNDTSRNWLIEHNSFLANGKAIRIAAGQDHGIRDLPGERLRTPRPHSHTIRANAIAAGRVGVELVGVEHTLLEDNRFTGNLEADMREIDPV